MSRNMVQALMAAISRRSWHDTEMAAQNVRDEVEAAVKFLAGTDINSLPNDFPLGVLAELRASDLDEARSALASHTSALAERDARIAELEAALEAALPALEAQTANANMRWEKESPECAWRPGLLREIEEEKRPLQLASAALAKEQANG